MMGLELRGRGSNNEKASCLERCVSCQVVPLLHTRPMTGGGRGAGQSTGSTGTLTPAGLGYFVRSISSLPRMAVPPCSRERRGEGRGKGISSVKRLLEVSQLLVFSWLSVAAVVC